MGTLGDYFYYSETCLIMVHLFDLNICIFYNTSTTYRDVAPPSIKVELNLGKKIKKHINMNKVSTQQNNSAACTSSSSTAAGVTFKDRPQ